MTPWPLWYTSNLPDTRLPLTSWQVLRDDGAAVPAAQGPVPPGGGVRSPGPAEASAPMRYLLLHRRGHRPQVRQIPLEKWTSGFRILSSLRMESQDLDIISLSGYFKLIFFMAVSPNIHKLESFCSQFLRFGLSRPWQEQVTKCFILIPLRSLLSTTTPIPTTHPTSPRIPSSLLSPSIYPIAIIYPYLSLRPGVSLCSRCSCCRKYRFCSCCSFKWSGSLT